MRTEKQGNVVNRLLEASLISLSLTMGMTQANKANTNARGLTTSPQCFSGNAGRDKYLQMVKSFAAPQNNLEEDSTQQALAYNWTASRVIDAGFVKTLTPTATYVDAKDYYCRLSKIQHYYDFQPNGYLPGYDPEVSGTHTGIIDRYVDDNAWIALGFMREYQHSKDVTYVKKAEGIYNMLSMQVDPVDQSIYWKEQLPGEKNKMRGIVSNGTTALLATKLFQVTGEQQYMQKATQLTSWIDHHLKDADGLYFDSIENNILGKTKWSYNQGTMIGLLTNLSLIDPKTYPVKNAVALANNSLHYFTSPNAGGKFEVNSPFFVSMYFKNVFYLAGVLEDKTLADINRTALSNYIKGIPLDSTSLIYQAGIVECEALLQLDPSKYTSLQ